MFRIVVNINEDETNTVSHKIEFFVRIFPDCTQAAFTLAGSTNFGTLEDIEDLIPFKETRLASSISFDNSYDASECGASGQLEYSLEQVNYPSGGYNPDLFEFFPLLDMVEVDLQSVPRDKHSSVVNYDSNGSVECDLSVRGTEECRINYQVMASNPSMNGTIGIASIGQLIVKSECQTLQSKYELSNSALALKWWRWNPLNGLTNSAAFDQGYVIGDPKTTVQMPMLFPYLSSSDDISLCGPIRYELMDPNSSETVQLQSSSGSVTYSLNSAVDEFVQLVKEAPDDNSSPIELLIEAG